MGVGAPFVGVGLLDRLLGAGDPGLQQLALSFRFKAVAQLVCLGGLDGRLGLADQRALDVLLVRQVGEVGLRRGEVCLGLHELSAIVGGIDLDDQVALVHDLIVGDPDGGDIARHFRRQRGDVAGGVGIVGGFVAGRAGPAVPVPRDIPGEEPGRDDQQNAQHREHPAEPGEPRAASAGGGAGCVVSLASGIKNFPIQSEGWEWRVFPLRPRRASL